MSDVFSGHRLALILWITNCVDIGAVSFHLLLLVTLASSLSSSLPKVKPPLVWSMAEVVHCAVRLPALPRPLPVFRQRRSEKGALPPLPLQTVVVVF